jgi:hypothetical protein
MGAKTTLSQTVGRRLAEPSTWAGFAAILTSAVQAWATRDPVAIGTTLAGVLAVVMPEKSGGA